MDKTFSKSILAACVLSSTGFIAETQADEHQGEDGKLYNLTNTFTDGKGIKYDVKLLELAKKSQKINVIIYYKGEDPSDQLNMIDERYKPILKETSEQLKVIENKYRPTDSLPEEDEIEFMQSKNATMSADDKSLAKSKKIELDEMLDKKRKEKAKVIEAASGKKLDEITALVKSVGGEVRKYVSLANAVSASIDTEMLQQLADYEDVLHIEYDHPGQPELDISVPSAGYYPWHSANFDGDPYDFGIVDDGVQEDHPAFTSANFNFCKQPGASVITKHGTVVSGVVLSNDTTYRGTAYGTDAVIWANAGDQSTTMLNLHWMISGPCQVPEVVNYSWRHGVANDTDYSSSDAFYDAFVHHYNTMITKSAGNQYWSDTSPTITHPATAYNLMAVANMDDQNTVYRNDDIRNWTSSVGPTLLNRKKPDITAPGTSIISTNSDWSSRDDFLPGSGTSMAAPHVAGAVILMEDGGNYIPMAQKAVLINTADAWDSNDTSTTSDDGRVYGSHWDKSYGWGYIDMSESYFNRGDYFVDSVVPRNNNNIANDYKLFKGRMYPDEKATLVWQRRANFVSGPSGNAFTLSDLNLRLYAEGSNSSQDSDLDGNDNVHQVAASSTMDAVVKVYSWSASFDGTSSERFALATEENFDAVAPPSLQIPNKTVRVISPSRFTVNVDVNNIGGVDSCEVTVTRGSVAGINGTSSVSIPAIAEGGSGVASFTLKASLGTINVPFTASTNCYDETYTASGNITLRSGPIFITP